MSSRTRNSARNVLFSEIAYGIIIILQFVNRSFFIRLLPEEYLGLGGLFSNVLSLLSLTEMGVGTALNFALYKPLKENDIETVKSIMQLYRRLYTMTGMIILTIGGAITPFLPYLIKDMPDNMQNIYLYFLLYLANSGITYFYTYKQSLIICDQKEYLTTIAASLFHILQVVLQMMVLICFQSYGLYLMVMIGVTVLQNLAISTVADQLFPYLKDKNRKKLSPETVKEIKKNGYALVFQKMGEVFVYATDNIIISKFVGFVSVGIYSNYLLIIQAVQMAAYRFFDAITASIGNLAVTDDKRYVEKILYRILFINAWMFIFCSVCLLCLFQPFIRLWIGSAYLLPESTLLIIVLNFYLEGMRATVVTFKRATGFYWQIRYKPVLESVLNLAVSIPLAIRFGIAGTLLGTIISTMSVSAIIEPYALFRHYFKKGFWGFVWEQIKYATVTIFAATLTVLACRMIKCGLLMEFIIRLFLCVFIPNICVILIFRKNENYMYLKEFFFSFIRKKKKIKDKI